MVILAGSPNRQVKTKVNLNQVNLSHPFISDLFNDNCLNLCHIKLRRTHLYIRVCLPSARTLEI